MMHGASADTPITVIENVSRLDQRVIEASLATLPEAASALQGPAVILYGLAPRRAIAALKEATA